ncbi:HNH endonuclease [Rhodococcus sp. BH5]|uniref:HNH endonuclease n=1 Tax=Rhodococcus sp. BH5 TaxID=2871702 RepID=UPI003FA6CA3D
MTALGKCGRKRRSDVKVCDHCRRARGTRHKVSIGTLLQRDGNSCGICSEPIDMKLVSPDMQRASVDHILPYSKGGTHDLGNLQLAHLYCNCIKNAREGFVIER